jgi:hypothetical protein
VAVLPAALIVASVEAFTAAVGVGLAWTPAAAQWWRARTRTEDIRRRPSSWSRYWSPVDAGR